MAHFNNLQLTKYRHLGSITFKRFDILLHPLQRKTLIKESWISLEWVKFWRFHESKDSSKDINPPPRDRTLLQLT